MRPKIDKEIRRKYQVYEYTNIHSNFFSFRKSALLNNGNPLIRHERDPARVNPKAKRGIKRACNCTPVYPRCATGFAKLSETLSLGNLRPKEQGGRCCNEGDVVILVSFLCCYRCQSCVYQRCHCCHFLTRCLGISVSDIMVIYNFFPIIIIVFITMAITFMIDMIFLFYFVHYYTSCSLSSIIHFYH